jgi:hypothetical protein
VKRDSNVVFEGSIPERYGAAPVESTMQAFVWRAVRE